MQASNDPNWEEEQQKLANDFDTPFSEPEDGVRHVPKYHPFFDDPTDEQEAYDESEEGRMIEEALNRRPTIRMRDLNDKHRHGPVKIVKPAHQHL